MKQCFQKMFSKEGIIGLFMGAFMGWLLAWGFGWFIPSSPVAVKNLPQKELSCILNQSYPLISKKAFDSRFQIQFDGKEVENPIFHSITISNSGKYAISNEDFKDKFSIDFKDCKNIINAQINEASNQQLFSEVIENASITGTMLTFSDFL